MVFNVHFYYKKVKAATSSITKNVFKCMGVWGGDREKYWKYTLTNKDATALSGLNHRSVFISVVDFFKTEQS